MVLQNYMFERFLERLSKSSYKDQFVIKGGILVASIMGLDTRSTMDLDTTLRNMPLTEEKILDALKSICSINLNDDVIFEIKSLLPIRKDDVYGGYCARVDALYDSMTTPLSIDISTGDVITPSAVKYEFDGIFDECTKIPLWGYNIETMLAEKVETILSRGIFNTRPRDFYDVYILSTTKEYDKLIFKEALKATATHRGSLEKIVDVDGILRQISENNDLLNNWEKYQSKFSYAKNISYNDVIKSIEILLK